MKGYICLIQLDFKDRDEAFGIHYPENKGIFSEEVCARALFAKYHDLNSIKFFDNKLNYYCTYDRRHLPNVLDQLAIR